MPHLIGSRIILREYRKDDIEFMRKWVNDSAVTDYLSDAFLYPHTRAQTESYLNSILEGKTDQKGFVIALKDTEEYIGQIDLFHIDWKNRSTEMGIVIAAQDHRNQGYGTEAIQLLKQFVFLQLNLNRLQLEVHDFNEKAIRCYEKSGFKEEGRIRQKHYGNGKYSDIVLMGILREEYDVDR